MIEKTIFEKLILISAQSDDEIPRFSSILKKMDRIAIPNWISNSNHIRSPGNGGVYLGSLLRTSGG